MNKNPYFWPTSAAAGIATVIALAGASLIKWGMEQLDLQWKGGPQ